MLPEDFGQSGPKVMSVGYLEDQPQLRFIERKVVQPKYPPVVWTKWVASMNSRMVVFQWCSPSGKRYGGPFEIKPEAWTTASLYPGPVPMEKGVWRVLIADKDGERPLLTTQFVVSGEADEPPAVQVASPN